MAAAATTATVRDKTPAPPHLPPGAGLSDGSPAKSRAQSEAPQAASSPTPAPESPSRAKVDAAPSPAPAKAGADAASSPAAPAQPDPTSDAPPSAADGPDPPPEEDVIEMEVFSQILDLDEDGLYDFSAGMVSAFFSQAQTAFEDMDSAYAAQDLKKLKDLGHFLKGSSAALGIYRVRESCEAIQHYGALRDEEAHTDLSRADALARIARTLKRVKGEYADAQRWLRAWYADKGGIPDTPAD